MINTPPKRIWISFLLVLVFALVFSIAQIDEGLPDDISRGTITKSSDDEKEWINYKNDWFDLNITLGMLVDGKFNDTYSRVFFSDAGKHGANITATGTQKFRYTYQSTEEIVKVKEDRFYLKRNTRRGEEYHIIDLSDVSRGLENVTGNVTFEPNFTSSAVTQDRGLWTFTADFYAQEDKGIISIDPTITVHVGTVGDTGMTILDNRTFVVAWGNNIDEEGYIMVWDTNGTNLTGEVEVTLGTSFAVGTDNGIEVGAINSTAFVIGWNNGIEGDYEFAVYGRAGNQINAAVDIDTTTGTTGDSQIINFPAMGFLSYQETGANDLNLEPITYGTWALSSTLGSDTNMGDARPALNTIIEAIAYNDTTVVHLWADTDGESINMLTRVSDGTLLHSDNNIYNPNGNPDTQGFVAMAQSNETLLAFWHTIDNNQLNLTFVVDAHTGARSSIPDVNIKTYSTPQTIAMKAETIRDTTSTEEKERVLFAFWDNETTVINATIFNGSGTVFNNYIIEDVNMSLSNLHFDIEYSGGFSNETSKRIVGCDDTFLISYVNQTGDAVVKTFFINGTTWNGVCGEEAVEEGDTENPVVTLVAPTDGSSFTNESVSFNATFTDNVNLTNGTLRIYNFTGELVNTTTQTIAGTIAGGLNITVVLPGVGNYTWNYEAVDNSSNSATAVSNFSVNITAVAGAVNQVNITQELTTTPNMARLYNGFRDIIVNLIITPLVDKTSSFFRDVRQAFTITSVIVRTKGFVVLVSQLFTFASVTDRAGNFFRNPTQQIIFNAETDAIAEVPDFTAIDGCTNITVSGEYRLTTDITDAGHKVCMNITASHVVFKGQGNIIDGISDTSNSLGILAFGVENVTIFNTTITDWDDNIRFTRTNNSLINHTLTIDSVGHGIRFKFSENITMRNNNMTNNSVIQLFPCDQDAISDAKFCSHDIDTSNTVEGLPAYFFFSNNSGVLDGVATNSVTCANCSNFTVKNIATPTRSDGFFFIHTNNSFMENITSILSYDDGIRLYFSGLNNITNFTVSEIRFSGLFIRRSSDNIFRNGLVNDTGTTTTSGDGIRLRSASNRNEFINVTVKNTAEEGLFWNLNSDDNTFRDGIIENSGEKAIRLVDTTGNKFFNNIINYSGSVNFTITAGNTFNTTQQSGTRVSHPGDSSGDIGGNYWTNVSATGFSDICVDADTDGFCDVSFSPTGSIDANDSLPYSDEFVSAATVNEINITQELTTTPLTAKTFGRLRDLIANFIITPIVDKTSSFFRDTKQSFTIITLVERTKGFVIEVSQQFTITTIVERSQGFIVSITQSFQFDSLVNRFAEFFRDIKQEFIFNAESKVNVVGVNEVDITQGFTITTLVDRFYSGFRDVNQVFTITSIVERTKGFVISITQTFQFDSLVDRLVQFFRDIKQQIIFNAETDAAIVVDDFTAISACQDLDIANTLYRLTSNVATLGTCFPVSADNITFDGQFNFIDGDLGVEDYGFYAEGVINLTIKASNITQFGINIFFNGTNNSIILNNTISGGNKGIALSDGFESYRNTISHNSIQSVNVTGIHGGSDGLMFNNSLDNLDLGILFNSTSHNNILTNNTISNNFVDGIIFSGSTNNTVTGGFLEMVNDTPQSFITMEFGANENELMNINFSDNTDSSDANFEIIASNYTTLTDFFLLNAWEIVNSTLVYKSTQFGEVRFIETFSRASTNPHNEVIISNNSADVTTTFGNLDANISLNGIGNRGFVSPVIRRDGVNCADCRNFTSLTADIVKFNITLTGNYSIGEGIVTFTANVTQELSTTANIARLYNGFRDLIVNLIITPIVDKTSSLFRDVSQGFTITTIVERSQGFVISVVQQFTITSIVDRTITFRVNIVQNFAINNVVDRFGQFFRDVVQGFVETFIVSAAPPVPDDVIAPVLNIIFPGQGSLHEGAILDIIMNSSENITAWTYSFNGGASNFTATNFNSSFFTAFFANTSDFNLTIYGTDNAGNIGIANIGFHFIRKITTTTVIYIFIFILALLFVIVGYLRRKPILLFSAGILFGVLSLVIGINGFNESTNPFLKESVTIVLAGIGLYYLITSYLKEGEHVGSTD